MRTLLAVVTVLAIGATAFGADLTSAAQKYADTGDNAAAQDLRGAGAAAIPAIREVKTDKDENTARLRNLLTELVLETAKIDPDSARVVHEVAKEEGKGKRYTNAERLYRRGEQLYENLKDDANKRKDKAKAKDYEEQQNLCDRMKDKAGHKAKGEAHTGLNLGFVRVGKDHDMSDEWE